MLQANAILDALLLTTSAHNPPVSLEALRRTSRGWSCSTSVMRGGSLKKATALHDDLEGALFLALLSLSKWPLRSQIPQESKGH
ncbi:hypothetical protein [Agrobacterium tumefaciens]|uniref:hypothetical protein n=1 Tax=Agrobacterium tumefaciens TaxID=358 RepID=UPI00287DE97F|nr:hypothetical protein [Agrobacterium tumefaciens]MDS7596092.1 hypothetical protein [Agrobacterium tumefaciens]